MDAGPQTLEKLFESSKQVFEIPTFQRQYVWRLEEQWEPLWEDVRNLAERYGELLAEGCRPGDAQKRAGRHFLGAVVVQRIEKPFGSPETWELIDGQQRLTTLQLLLHAACVVFEAQGLSDQAVALERLLRNDPRLTRGDAVFKLWPTGGDQDAFRAVMSPGSDLEPFGESQLIRAHRYFTTQVGEWLNASLDPGPTSLAEHLLVTLLALMELVVIKLDGSDDAFVVFETLNARGTPLLASDLVKNFVLQTAVQQGHDKDAFHEEHWRSFEEYRAAAGRAPWWMTEVRQGRLFRPRLDVFLNHWLVLRTRTEVKSRDLFPVFKKHVESTSPTDIVPIVRHFGRVAATYRDLESWPADSPEGRFLYRWNVVDAGVLTPVLLQILSATERELTVERRRRALRHLESYLVRRMVCRLTTKDYNRLFLDLVGTVDADLARADEVTCDWLLAQDAFSRTWPDDDAVIDAITNLPLYGRINQGRIRMVLEGLEEALRTDKAEDRHAPRDREIEHLMPVSWEANWPLPVDPDPDAHHRAIGRRNRLIHTLGNLTLLAGKLNRSVSNDGWVNEGAKGKRDAIREHTTLHLNKRLLDEFDGGFDEAAIEKRGRQLAALACQVWPRGRT